MSISNLLDENRVTRLEKFQADFDLKFSDLALLNQAFIHTSYVRENNIEVSFSYEKLEFYGDAVLKLVVSDILYNSFKDWTEGQLTDARAQIVSDKNISKYAQILGFEELIILGRNEKKQGGAKKESILACAFEALLGAIFIEYKEAGYKKIKEFFAQNFLSDILSIENNLRFLNPKAVLQEYTQAKNHTLPCYELVDEVGQQHNKTFFVQVKFENEVIGEGTGKSLKEAHQEAAYCALNKLGLTK